MKALFLDIDGVLNSIDNLDIDLEKVSYLKEIVDKTDAKIILSSSWRFGFKNKIPFREETIQLVDILNKYNLTIYDFTSFIGYRNIEINDWLIHHDVDNFLILDDELYNISSNLEEHLVRTNYLHGLTYNDVEKSINILNGKNKKLTL